MQLVEGRSAVEISEIAKFCCGIASRQARIALVLKQAEDGTAVGEVCRKAGISEATLYN